MIAIQIKDHLAHCFAFCHTEKMLVVGNPNRTAVYFKPLVEHSLRNNDSTLSLTHEISELQIFSEILFVPLGHIPLGMGYQITVL